MVIKGGGLTSLAGFTLCRQAAEGAALGWWCLQDAAPRGLTATGLAAAWQDTSDRLKFCRVHQLALRDRSSQCSAPGTPPQRPGSTTPQWQEQGPGDHSTALDDAVPADTVRRHQPALVLPKSERCRSFSSLGPTGHDETERNSVAREDLPRRQHPAHGGGRHRVRAKHKPPREPPLRHPLAREPRDPNSRRCEQPTSPRHDVEPLTSDRRSVRVTWPPQTRRPHRAVCRAMSLSGPIDRHSTANVDGHAMSSLTWTLLT
mgnify:FL=1